MEQLWQATSEEQLATTFEQMLHVLGWSWVHLTHTQQTATMLDYLCWRDRVVHVELKRMGGKLTKDRTIKGMWIQGQASLIPQLIYARAEVYVWTPADMDIAQYILSTPPNKMDPNLIVGASVTMWQKLREAGAGDAEIMQWSQWHADASALWVAAAYINGEGRQPADETFPARMAAVMAAASVLAQREEQVDHEQ